MAGEEEDKNKEKSNMSNEELEEAAKKAAEALAESKKALEGDKDKSKEGEGSEDEETIDRNNLDADKTLKYIDKLKDENARRRIANKKLDEKLTAATTQLESATTALNEAMTKLKDFEGKTESQKAKERSDLENAQKTIEDLQAKIENLQGEVTNRDQELKRTSRQVQVQSRENMVDRLVRMKEGSFVSDFERDGFIASLTEMNKEGEFKLNNDEVIYETMKFIEASKARVDHKVPGAGPSGRKTTTPLGDEIQALLSTPKLTSEQLKRLDELISLSGQAQKAPAR
jgi:chromosome segregation ATPase